MASSTVVPLGNKSQAAFIAYYQNIQNRSNLTRPETRSRMEEVDRQYQREKDFTQEHIRAQQANRGNDPTKFQNMTVPVVMPQVESAVEYQTSVFLTGYPMFAVVASPQYMDEAVQMETVLENEAKRGGWPKQLMMFFRDGFKHNFAPIEVEWADEVTYSIETNLKVDKQKGQPKKSIWSGNKLKRLDPYNTFVDTRVPPNEVYKRGEFAGYTELMSRIELKTLISTLPEVIISNIKPAFESGTGTVTAVSSSADSQGFYSPSINPAVEPEEYKQPGVNWLSWAGLSEISKDIAYKDSYELTKLYCRVLPSEFNLKIPNSNTPQIYKLYIVNHEHIIYAELQTNAHNYIPIFIGQPMDDGLSYQTKSLAENGIPFQELTSSYMNSIVASRRRAISDRTLYDPSRVSSAHINSANPSAKIPVRPAAYGKNVAEAVYQFPYREDQAGNDMQQVSALLGMSNTLAGQNQARQGQFVKGNKTLHEFESVMQNAQGRDQMVSILLEDQVLIPLKHVLKTNILQFQGGDSLYNRDQDKQIEIDPVALRKAVMEFKISDGLIPSSKIIAGDSWASALQVIGSSPQISSGYNLAPLFSYLMKTQGADLKDFEKSTEQVAYEQALQAWQGAVMAAAEKGIAPESLGPQPLPEQFGYQPANNKPTPPEADSPASPDPTQQGVL